MFPIGLLFSVFGCSIEAQPIMKNKLDIINIFFIDSIYNKIYYYKNPIDTILKLPYNKYLK